MKSTFLQAVITLFSFLSSLPVLGQIQIILGPEEIGENQGWTITVTVNNGQLKTYDNFPEIPGFRKRGTSSSSQTSFVNGQVSSSQSIIMNYAPERQGIITVPSFKMKINDMVMSIPGGRRIKVGPPVQVQAVDPFRSLFERDPSDMFGRGTTEFVDVKEDAFLALTTSKDEVYVGEGFTATLSFLVADNNQAAMQFYELGKQLAEILKKLKPSNCWEENFNIENIVEEQVEINGKGYKQYKIYQGSFYPLNTKPIQFPSVGLELIKFKVARNPTFFGQNRQEDFKTFYSKPKTIKVKELPAHPLRDAVAVGDYRLSERINSTQLQTGQSVGYEFDVYGEGNISAIENPTVRKDNNFEFYEPNVKQNINREKGRVTGTKSFSYFMIPKEPGTYNLGDYFQWVFFNPQLRKYDTLRSHQVVTVNGASQKNQAIESNDLGPFYDRLETADNTLRSVSGNSYIQLGVNIFILLLLGGSVYLVFKRKA
jgi:BatD DUF11 like domain